MNASFAFLSRSAIDSFQQPRNTEAGDGDGMEGSRTQKEREGMNRREYD